MKKIAIIIVNYKNNERTKKFVSEELSKIKIDHVVVIVNNEADKDSNRYFQQNLNAVVVDPDTSVIEQSHIYVINNPENSGFARGNNMGVKFVNRFFHPKYLIISNNDIRFVTRDIVEKMIQKFDSLNDVGIMGPKIIGLDGKLQSPEPFVSYFDRYVLMYICTPFISKASKRKKFNLDYSELAAEGVHYKLTGCFFIVENEAYMNCGMMDEKTFLYAEEMILSERMKRIGKTAYYFPEVAVIHEHGVTTKKYLGNKKICIQQINSDIYYYNKYIGVPKFQLLIGKYIYIFIILIKNTFKW